jgi:TonB family protein
MQLKTILLCLLLSPLCLYAQLPDNTSQQYAVRYVKDHWFMQNGENFNVIDTDIEWPEAIYYEQPQALQHYISELLFGQAATDFDSIYSAFRANYGQIVTGQLKTLPDDRRFCYVTIAAKVKAYSPDKWICYEINYTAKPEALSPVKAKAGRKFVVYDVGQKQVLNTEEILKSRMISSGSADPEFFDMVYAPTADKDFGEWLSTDIAGVWFENGGKTVALHVTCYTDRTTLDYDTRLPYKDVRYLLTKAGRRLVEKEAAKPSPQYVSPPATWNGDLVYKTADEMPLFKGGQEGLKDYLARSYSPAQMQGGRVMVSFVVDKEGWTKDVRVLKPVSPETDRQAVSIVKGMPQFTPGNINGNPVCVRIYGPIQFKLAANP